MTLPRENVKHFHVDSHWFCGPEFLRRSEQNWPKDSRVVEDVLDETLEENAVLHINEENSVFDELANRVSSWKKLVRVVAWVKRFVNNCHKSAVKLGGELNADEFFEPLK